MKVMKAHVQASGKNGEITVAYRDDGKGGYEWYVIANVRIFGLNEQEAWEKARKLNENYIHTYEYDWH